MEKQFKGAVFFDYDGTLTDKDAGLFVPSPKTVEAIKRLQKNGYAACLATGRSLKYIPKFNIDFDIIITANGGCTVYKNKVVGEKPFTPETIKSLTEYFTEKNMIFVLENYAKCYVNLPNDKLFNKMISMFNVKPTVFTPLEQYSNENIYKILLIYRNTGDIIPLKSNFSDIADITVPNDGITSCDINPKDVSKANGVIDVCQYFGIDIKNTYAFGDGENDRTMLQSAGFGIAMQKHHPCLDDVCSMVTGEASKNGIYDALTKLGLIDKFWFLEIIPQYYI